MITTIELKQKFLDFFKSKDHKVIEQASLIPENDNTVLFTTAGMHPLVPFLLGQPHPLGKRLVNYQLCIRTTDIDEIGDATHFSMFEMLGNWSLGDYFKKESIAYSYEFLTSKEWLGLDKNRLAITVFSGNDNVPIDKETIFHWLEQGVPKERIVAIADNWWGPAGDSGPCGPDTEMFYWKDNSRPAPLIFDPDDENWVEIWNNVFLEYNKTKDGKFEELEQKNIDTGLGTERVAMILNGLDDAFKVGKIKEIYDYVLSLAKDKENTKAIKIITDHLRAATFILADSRGAIPSNTDQGYILRRFIRRAIRYGRLIGIENNFCSKVSKKIMDLYDQEYPHLKFKYQFVLNELEKEENKFNLTLENGLKEFNRMIETQEKLSGKDAFLLYQSFGFPIEVVEELAKEKNISIDVSGFIEEEKKHKEISRAGAEHKFKGGLAEQTNITTRYHTATHILNQSLRNIINKEIRQKGSNITSERLRFDFNFDRKLTPEEIQAVEDEVNKVIARELDVVKESMPLAKAIESGAQAEFGARYPEVVFVYSVGDYSKEICMGPHVNNTKELGRFKIIKEEGIAAGVRRIKAVLEDNTEKA
ncbi:MAG TPA: alanine--tRNA ligase [archaeon]|nr:alanine--tRNA ligase [archaeon]HPV66374.1 alanine--tRNA ligase [archaeon]